MLRHGYTITLEWCGQPTQRYVVRQYGEWVGQHATRSDAEAAIRDRDGVFIPDPPGVVYGPVSDD